AGAHVLVTVEHHDAVLVFHRYHGFGEVALFPGFRGAALGFHREGVHVFTGEAFDGGDQVGADALRHKAGAVVGHRVHGPGAAVGTHRDAAHGFHAAHQH